jgi:hypothetical protein
MRPKVKIVERKRVNLPGLVVDREQGTFIEVSYETEIKVGESEGGAVARALNELTAELGTGPAIKPGTLEDRLRKMQKGQSS